MSPPPSLVTKERHDKTRRNNLLDIAPVTLHVHFSDNSPNFDAEKSTLCMLGNSTCLFVVCRFSRSTFSKTSFRNTKRVSNSLDPVQAQRFVGPELSPNWLQRLSADDTSRQRITIISVYIVVFIAGCVSKLWRIYNKELELFRSWM